MPGAGIQSRVHPEGRAAADDALDEPAGFAAPTVDVEPPLRGVLAAVPERGWVVLVWLLSRLFTAAWTLVALSRQAPLAHLEAVRAGYFTYASMWDGVFYEHIAARGYPATIVIGAGGANVGGEWAFLPGYPLTVRALQLLLPLDWPAAATSVSLLASLGFLLVAHQLFRIRADPGTALTATALVAFATAAPVLQYAYAEALGLFLLSSALLLLCRGRYLLAAPVVLLAALTRPIGVPLFVATAILASVLIVHRVRSGRPVPTRTGWSLATLVAASAIGAIAWPVVAGLATGVPDAYLRVEGAWHGGVHPPLLAFVSSLVGRLGGLAGTVAAILLVAGSGALMLSRPVRRLGLVLWTWVGCLLGYLILLTPVSSSTPRLLLPAFPLALVAAGLARSRWSRVLLLVLSALSQVAYILVLWHVRDGITDNSP